MMPLLLLYPFYTYGQWEDGKALEVPIVTHLKGSVLPGIKYCRRLLSTGKDVEGRVHQGPLHRTIMSRRYNSLGWGRVSGPDYSCGTGLSLGKDPFFSTLHSSPCSILSFSWSNKKSYMRPFQSHPFSYLRSTLNSRCWNITIFYHHDQGSPSPPHPMQLSGFWAWSTSGQRRQPQYWSRWNASGIPPNCAPSSTLCTQSITESRWFHLLNASQVPALIKPEGASRATAVDDSGKALMRSGEAQLTSQEMLCLLNAHTLPWQALLTCLSS